MAEKGSDLPQESKKITGLLEPLSTSYANGVLETPGRIQAREFTLHAIHRRGEKTFYGDFLINAQGEDVVARRNSHPDAIEGDVEPNAEGIQAVGESSPSA